MDRGSGTTRSKIANEKHKQPLLSRAARPNEPHSSLVYSYAIPDIKTQKEERMTPTLTRTKLRNESTIDGTALAPN